MSDNPCEVNGDQGVSDMIADRYADRMRALGDNLLHGTLTLDDFHANMQDAIRLSYLHQAVAGAPDSDERLITSADRARLEGAIGYQYEYLDNFMSDIEAAVEKEGQSLDFIPNRASMYAGAAKPEYWKQAVSVDLPTYPGEQQCMGNCGCSWDLQCEYDDSGNAVAVNAYWRRSKDDSCADCVSNEEQYNPLRIDLAETA